MSEARRNHYGQYLIVPPDGGTPIGYQRVTTAIKPLESEGGLIAWKGSLAARGFMLRPGLKGRLEALMAAHPVVGPYYGNKSAMTKLFDEAAEAGGSADRAEQGTALHSIAEQYDLGRHPIPTQMETAAWLDSYIAALKTNGITFDQRYIEATLVLDELRIAGMADRLVCHVPGFDLPLVGDLKTGASLDYAHHAHCAQLACYAHADAVYVYGDAADGSQDQRLAMPEVDQQHALIIHAPAGQTNVEFHIIDIGAGWPAVQLGIQVGAWRKRRGLSKPYRPPTGDPFDGLTVGAPVGRQPLPPSVGDDPPFGEPVTVAATSIVETPALPEGQPRRMPPRVALQIEAMSKRPLPDEGGPCDAVAAATLTAAYSCIGDERRAWVSARTIEANVAKVPFSLRTAKTVRRFEILRALITLSGQYCGGFNPDSDSSHELIRALLFSSLPDVAFFGAIPIGHLIGALDADGATRFAQAVDDFAGGDMTVFVDELTDTIRLRSSAA